MSHRTWRNVRSEACNACQRSQSIALCHHASHGADPVAREACKCSWLHGDEQRVYLNRDATAQLPAVSTLESIPIMTERCSFVTAAIRRPPKPVDPRDEQFAHKGYTSLSVEFTDDEVKEIEALYDYCRTSAVRVSFNPSKAEEPRTMRTSKGKTRPRTMQEEPACAPNEDKKTRPRTVQEEPACAPKEDRHGFNIPFPAFFRLSQPLRQKLFSEGKLARISKYFGAEDDDVVVYEFRFIVAPSGARQQREHTDARTYPRAAVSEVTAFRRNDVPGTIVYKGTRSTFTHGWPDDLDERQTRATTTDQCVLFDAAMAHCGGPNNSPHDSVRITAMYTHRQALSQHVVRAEVSAAVSTCSFRNRTFAEARAAEKDEPKRPAKKVRTEVKQRAEPTRTLRSRGPA